MKASVAVLSTIVGLSTVMLASSIPANATHTPNCGGRMVVTGYFYGPNSVYPDQPVGLHVHKYCIQKLHERGKQKYGSSYSGLAKIGGPTCTLETPGDPISKFWCVCSAEPCRNILLNPGAYKSQKFEKKPSSEPSGRSLRPPSRSPSGAPNFPGLRMR